MTTPPAVIHREELVALLGTRRLVLVEALGASFFADAHLPGAVNVPPSHVDDLAPHLLPDREALVVVYCSSSGTASRLTAGRLLELGYADVRVYPGGKEDWVEVGLPVERTSDER